MSVTFLPANYTWHPYELNVAKAFFSENFKRFYLIWHRRAGKDHICKTLAAASALQEKITVLYTLPTIAQVKKVIWRDINEQGQELFDYLPDDYIEEINKSDLFIKLTNGSIIQFAGADNFDSLRGTNPKLIIFSEFAYQSPSAWDIMSPILAKNNGRAIFITTPFGKNHAYRLYEINKNNPRWFTNLLTVKDTKDIKGNLILPPERIIQYKEDGMSDAKIQQEFYCSFTAAIEGAYFAKELDEAEKEDRIYDFPIDRNFPVDTYWDLGNTTAVWFIQERMEGYRAIYYYENYNLSIRDHWNNLCDMRDKLGIIFRTHYGPHDVTKRDYYQSQSVMQQAEQQLGVRFERVPRISKKNEGIEALRTIFNRLIFHKTHTNLGRECLLHYHSEFKEGPDIWTEKPADTWANHGVDALMGFAQQKLLGGNPHIGYNRRYKPPV